MGRCGSLGLVLAGCGDTLLGGSELDQRIAVSPLPERAAWEVRWVGPQGLKIDCERVDATPDPQMAPQIGGARLPLPELPLSGRLQEGEGFSWALALPVLVSKGAPFPEVGPGSLESDLGVWGTSAPLGWLLVEGDREAAGEILRVNGGSLPASGWVEVFAPLVAERGSFDGALGIVDPYLLAAGLYVSTLQWSDDEELDLWAGDLVGGIASSCGNP